MPEGPVAFELRMHRLTTAPGSEDHVAMLQANHALLPRLQAAGGKIYPPYCPILSGSQWQEHYGAETWQRFAAAKKRFDPNNVLTPGAGIFSH
jgi:FAD/FMN-containing dehydrogenase